MNTLNHLLFPTDFSDNARKALPYALEIATRTGASLHILHSIEEPYDFAPMLDEIKKGVSRKVNRLFQEIIEEIKLQDRYSDIEIKTYIEYGRAIYSILDQARSLDIDLILMGTKGRSGIEKILFGSTTAEIIGRSNIPVFAIPKEAETPHFEQILFATEYNDGDLGALEFLTPLAELFKAEIKVFHSTRKNKLEEEIKFRGFRELVKEVIPYKKIRFEQAVTESFFEAIADEVEENNIELLVMKRYQKQMSLLDKRNTKDMSYYTSVPLLMIPAENLTSPVTGSESRQENVEL